MLDGVLADMRRGKIGHVLVKDRMGVAVWRSSRTVTVRSGARRRAASRPTSARASTLSRCGVRKAGLRSAGTKGGQL